MIRHLLEFAKDHQLTLFLLVIAVSFATYRSYRYFERVFGDEDHAGKWRIARALLIVFAISTIISLFILIATFTV